MNVVTNLYYNPVKRFQKVGKKVAKNLIKKTNRKNKIICKQCSKHIDIHKEIMNGNTLECCDILVIMCECGNEIPVKLE